jgi:hypothetical protein
MTVEKYIHCILMLVWLYKPELHNIFNHGVTKSKKRYIKSMAQHDMLSYYRDYVFFFVKVELLHYGVLLVAHCV